MFDMQNRLPRPYLDGPYTTLSGAGAVDVQSRTTRLTSTGSAQAITLADGSVDGQRKSLIHAVDGGSMVLTPAHLGDSLTNITFTNVRDWVELEWSAADGKWYVVAYGGVTFA